MILSTFRLAWENKPEEIELSWEQFVSGLGPHRIGNPTKKANPAFSPAEFKPGATRSKKTAIQVWFGVLDLDGLSETQLLSVVQVIESQGLAAVLYTTWGHYEANRASRGALWKVRICVAFDRPVPMADWPLFWHSLNSLFGGLNDPQTKDVCRIYFQALVPPDAPLSAQMFHVWQGVPLAVDSLSPGAAGVPAMAHVQGTEKITRDRLQRLGEKWRRSRDSEVSEQGVRLIQVCKGEPCAEPGNVDIALFRLSRDIIREIPNADPASIAAHFAQSVQAMALRVRGEPVDVETKLSRAQETIAAETLADDMAPLVLRRLRIRQAFAHVPPGDRDSPYTTQELGQMAKTLGCGPDEFTNRWMIQRGKSFYVLGPGAVYSPAYTPDDTSNAIIRDLAPAYTAGVDLWVETAAGPMRKPLPSLMAQYGSVAQSAVVDLNAQRSHYDPRSKCFTEAPCPVRADLIPTYDPEVAAWLEVLCGPAFHDVNQWLAWATDLDSTCAALMFTGPKDTGKSLFASGVARLWTKHGPTPLSSVMSNFNEALVDCPLAFADEHLPVDWRGAGRTAEIREIIAARSRPYKRKHIPESRILGAIRVCIAANNDEIMAIRENLSRNDMEAIADRFYHIPVNPAAAELLRLVDVQSFVTCDRVANHALWLRDNVVKVRNGRFIIKSTDLTFYQGLSTQSGIRSSLCQWLVGYLLNPSKMQKNRDVRIMGGKLYVKAPAIIAGWDLYVTNELPPKTGALARAITDLSTGKRNPIGREGHFREIDMGNLRAWVRMTEFASVEALDTALTKDTVDDTRTPNRGVLLN